MRARKKAELDDIHKVFETVDSGEIRQFTALDGVSLSFLPGEIHVLLGENGAGKSTLVHILSGLHSPSRGAIRLGGETLTFDSTADALKRGIAMVHQRPLLAREATVLENVLLGAPGFFLGKAKAKRRLAALESDWGIALSGDQRAGNLSPADCFRTALLSALWRDPDFLILDEPSGVLSPDERVELFAALERARERGLGVILITHRLEEALHRADRISVLRRGRLVWSSAVRNGYVDAAPQKAEAARANPERQSTEVPLTEAFLAALLDPEQNPADRCVLSRRTPREATDTSIPAIEFNSVSFSGKEREPLCSISFQAMRGTVTTIAGYPGSGLRTLEDILSGMIAPDEGTLSIAGIKIARSKISSARFRASGIASIPSDRAFRGSHPDITIADLLSPYAKTGFFRDPQTTAINAAALLLREGIDASPESAARTLSGGQLQRLILARELETDPSIIVLASPEWGLDVKSVERLRVRIAELAEAGKAVIVLTEETGSAGICPPTHILKDGAFI